VNGRVAKAGNKGNIFKSFRSAADVPSRYRNDPRFSQLSYDPAKAKVDEGSLKEAMACLEVERQGFVKPKIQRDQTGAVEIFDGDGVGWDVKTGAGPFFNSNSLGNSIKGELNKPDVPNSITGVPQKRRIILDCTYLDDNQLDELRAWLSNNLSAEERSRMIEINVEVP
jgi:hypothetical protein